MILENSNIDLLQPIGPHVMWDKGAELEFFGGILLNWGRTEILGVGHDHGSQPEPRLHHLIRLIHEINQTENFHREIIFKQIIINFQSPLHGYI